MIKYIYRQHADIKNSLSKIRFWCLEELHESIHPKLLIIRNSEQGIVVEYNEDTYT